MTKKKKKTLRNDKIRRKKMSIFKHFFKFCNNIQNIKTH